MKLAVVFGILVNLRLYSAVTDSEKSKRCETFSEGVVFDDGAITGNWYPLNCWSKAGGNITGCSDDYSFQFQAVSPEERSKMSDSLGKIIKNVNWESLSLKMKIPLTSSGSDKNTTFDYYLEKRGNNGTYETLRVAVGAETTDKMKYHRTGVRLKIVQEKFLAMMFCDDKFTYLMARDPPKIPLDPNVKKIIDNFSQDIDD